MAALRADAEAGIRIAIFSSGMQTGRMGLMYNKKGGSGMKRRMITVKNVWKKAVALGTAAVLAASPRLRYGRYVRRCRNGRR